MKVYHDNMTDHCAMANLIHLGATSEQDMGRWRPILATYILCVLRGNLNAKCSTFTFLLNHVLQWHFHCHHKSQLS
jgi:hypothetical protein